MEPPAQDLRSCEEQVTERAKLALHRELVGGSGGLEVIASTLDSLGLTGSFPSRHTPAANSNVSTADTWRGPIVSPRFCSGLSMTAHLGKARMKNRLGFIKSTLVGGFFFLIAAVIIVFSFRQADWRIESIGQSSLSLFGIESLIGGLALDIGAITVAILLCFIAGLIAKHASAKRIRDRLDATLLSYFPGYAFIKGLTENLRQTEELAESFLPVLVKFDDYAQIAFETQREASGRTAVYLPGAPNPWSGTIVYVSSERVTRLPITLTEALRNIRSLGKGSIDVSQEQEVGTAQSLQKVEPTERYSVQKRGAR